MSMALVQTVSTVIPTSNLPPKTVEMSGGVGDLSGQDSSIKRLQGILEDDLTGHKFDNKEYMTYFTLVYNM